MLLINLTLFISTCKYMYLHNRVNVHLNSVHYRLCFCINNAFPPPPPLMLFIWYVCTNIVQPPTILAHIS